MICHRLLSGDEDSFRLAMCLNLTKEEKCTQYKLAKIAEHYRLDKNEVLDIFEDSFVVNSKDLQEFLNNVQVSLQVNQKSFIGELRNKSNSTRLGELEEDFCWYLKLVNMGW